jgi:prevent-host-death family protein
MFQRLLSLKTAVMNTTVKVSEAKAHLLELLARVEAGEEVIISHGSDPIARLSRIRKQTDLQLLVNEVRAARGKVLQVSHDQVLSWRDEGVDDGTANRLSADLTQAGITWASQKDFRRQSNLQTCQRCFKPPDDQPVCEAPLRFA